jgi:hypothetical protein
MPHDPKIIDRIVFGKLAILFTIRVLEGALIVTLFDDLTLIFLIVNVAMNCDLMIA